MLDIRRISNSRWWHKKKNWLLFAIFLFLVFVRISKGAFYKDLYYFISKPFWPGQFQKELILKSIDQESLVKLNLVMSDNVRLRKILSLQYHPIMIIFQQQLFLEKQEVGGDK